MEAVEELPLHITGFEGVKDNITDIPETSVTELTEDCHKTNGISESSSVDVGGVADTSTAVNTPQATLPVVVGLAAGEALQNTVDELCSVSEELVVTHEGTVDSSLNEASSADSGIDTAHERMDVDSTNISEDVNETTTCPIESTIIETEIVDTETILDSTGESVKFETQVLVEQAESVISTTNDCNAMLNYDNDGDNKILSELDGHSLDLSEALGTPDVPDGSENNNASLRQEVFNKEELLDILEGNEPDQSQAEVAQRALQQLTKLARKKKRSSLVTGKQAVKKVDNQAVSKAVKQLVSKPEQHHTSNTVPEKQPDSKPASTKQPVSKPASTKQPDSKPASTKNKPLEENLVKSLVDDWEDDEPDEAKKLLQDSEQLLRASKELIEQEEALSQDDTKPAADSTITEDPALNKSSEEGPQKRLSRVIKKKVIFDPDNPDTFTKGKAIKNKDPLPDKETPTLPKKVRPEQSTLRANSKSPVNKTLWKKPTPKKNAQYKRLSEVDKLLMDEGAVNMIYQLTPEAPKGRKNMRTKAEFIKKINQSSTPDAKEMKFRERKKDMPKEEGEGKKGLRTSISGSVKSASVGEDFENTSADDSIIYRRHSSSSYSSTCMSPRRLSDVEGAQSVAQALQQTADCISAMDIESAENGQRNGSDIFMADVSETPATETIKKKDCLTLKEKLNSKLTNALKKRKREIKTEKPMKQKKLTPKLNKNKETVVMSNFKTLSISVHDRLAEIHIDKSGSPANVCGLETILELTQALDFINSRHDISITLLTSEAGTVCSNLDLKPLLETNMEKKISHALAITSAARSLLSSLQEHSKVVVCGVEGACEGLSLAVLALSDVVVASERASFALAGARDAPPVPGIAALASPSSRLSHHLVRELVLCGRQLSAGEAMARGLVSRVLWPPAFRDQLRAWANDVAAQPLQSLLLKKKLLSADDDAESKSTFQRRLAAEQDQLSAYWSSLEGQETLRAHLNAA